MLASYIKTDRLEAASGMKFVRKFLAYGLAGVWFSGSAFGQT